jgi:hypothetical protein
MVVATFQLCPKNEASTEGQRLLALHLGICMGCAATLLHNHAIGRISRQKLLQRHRYYVLKMSGNGASTIFVLASWVILAEWNADIPQ